MSHRFFDHTADVGADIEAPSRDALFTEALRAFTDTLTPLDRLDRLERTEEPLVEKEIRCEADSLEDLMIEWLEELLFLFEVDSLLFFGADARVEERPPGYSLRATARGVTYDPDRHPLKVLIKGITYHELTVEESPDGWRARVILDI